MISGIILAISAARAAFDLYKDVRKELRKDKSLQRSVIEDARKNSEVIKEMIRGVKNG